MVQHSHSYINTINKHILFYLLRKEKLSVIGELSVLLIIATHTLNKPCFVSTVLKRCITSYVCGWQSSIYRLLSVFLSVQFLQENAPTIIWVSHSWGLPRSTCIVSYTAPSLWHFQRLSAISEDLGLHPAVSQNGCLSLFFH